MSINFDKIRTGRSLQVEAQNYAQQKVKNIDDPDEANAEFTRIYTERHAELVREHNKQSINKLPATALMVNDDNRNTSVLRYSLKQGSTIADGLKALQVAENARTSPDFDGKEETIDNIIATAFDIHNITFEQAMSRPYLKQNPYDLLQDAALDQMDSSDKDKLGRTETMSNHNDVRTEVIAPKPINAISGTQLSERMDEIGISDKDLADKVGSHHMTVKKWKRTEVPSEMIQEVYLALA